MQPHVVLIAFKNAASSSPPRYIKNRPNIPKLRFSRNNATYERFWIRPVFGPFWGRVICIINDILSNKTTKCLIQTISVMFNRIYSLKFQKIQNFKIQLEQFKNTPKTCIFEKKNTFFVRIFLKNAKFCPKSPIFLMKITKF